MGSSLAAGVRAAAGAAGWVIGLADMPWLKTETIARVAMGVQAGASICAPVCRGRRGHPVGFAAGWRDSLLALSCDQGARGLLAAYPEAFVAVPTLDAGALRDVDVAADLET
jgi:molybdenum cofactor cytidylyltransferase